MPPCRDVQAARAPQIAGRTTKQRQESFVESADAAEPCGEGDLGHRQMGFVDELLGEQNAAGLGNSDRRCAKMLAEEAPELPLTHTQSTSQGINTSLVQGAELNQRQGARYGIRRAAPRAEVGRGFRPAPQTWAKACLLRSRRRGVECHILRPRRPRWTDGAAVDARGFDAGEEPAVETGIAQADRAVASAVIEIHARNLIRRRGPV